jgi:hypothetical protein
MPLIATNLAGARSFHAVADAADRLRKKPTLQVTLETAPSDAALTDAIRRQRLNQSLTALKGKK